VLTTKIWVVGTSSPHWAPPAHGDTRSGIKSINGEWLYLSMVNGYFFDLQAEVKNVVGTDPTTMFMNRSVSRQNRGIGAKLL